MLKPLYSGSIVLLKLMQGDAGKKLNQISDHHPETAMHEIRVALVCTDLGYENGFYEESKITPLSASGLLHDIGKIDIPLKILDKKSALTEEERNIIMKHCRLGFQLLKEKEYDTVRKIIVASHEYSRNPYPRSRNDRRKLFRGIERRNNDGYIEKCAQILAAADTCDALASKRAYKEPLTKEEIERTLKDQFTGDIKYIDQVLARYRIS